MRNTTRDNDCVKEYFNHWKSLIIDINKIDKTEILQQGRSAALLLACCYIEALGKLYFFDEKKDCLSSKALFIKTLQLFNFSKTTAECVYKDFRCSFVHTGPESKTSTVTNKSNNNVEVDIEWFITTLEKLHKMVKAKYDGCQLSKIAEAIDWHPQVKAVCQDKV